MLGTLFVINDFYRSLVFVVQLFLFLLRTRVATTKGQELQGTMGTSKANQLFRSIICTIRHQAYR